MSWEIWINSYRQYLSIEKSLSTNSVDAYTRDIKKLGLYFSDENHKKSPKIFNMKILWGF